MRHWIDHIPKLYRLGLLSLGGILLVALGLYSVSVYVEKQVLDIGEKTCVVQEDNHDLELDLEQIKSYRNVSASTQNLDGLVSATDVINVSTPGEMNVALPKSPVARVPVGAYGY
ncbi:MAG: hypothetical protein KC476_08335 [Cyanobacteria bacterium HKST-UBA06]|nr:hypothetical protein [Cyanobacteria bacterium HKST-UBA04]MCA9807948.1 hypothetical protein [Cyanobacteria bacterium HKST-UBA06]